MNTAGTLFVVATPIGNLEDMTLRAIRVLKEVNFIAAEDTRHSRKLLQKYGISTPMVPFHQHNQTHQSSRLIKHLSRGESIALISDAGTPLISDPGHALVTASRKHGIPIVPIPGASALTCALSVFGIPVENTNFVGFLPAKKAERLARLKQLSEHRGSLVFYEAPHRIARSLEDMCTVFGSDCEACIAREMTKIHEEIRKDCLAELVEWVTSLASNCKGEFVVAVVSPGRTCKEDQDQVDETLRVLMAEMSASKSAKVASRLSGGSRNALYRRALQIKEGDVDR